MKVNFDIIDNHALNLEGQHIDLHNNFDFVGLDYNVANRAIKLNWKKAIGEWIEINEISSLTLVHKSVTFFEVIDKGENKNHEDATCLAEITYFSSTSREINDEFILQSKPNKNDDIIFFFENGQRVRIHCEQIELTINESEI